MSKYIKEVRVFNFGKYKGQPVAKICEEQPEYVKWVTSAIKDLKLNIDEKKILSEKLNKQNKKNIVEKLIENDKILIENG